MPDCYYESSEGQKVQLNGPTTWIGTGEGLRGNAWGYSLGTRTLTGIVREAREITFSAWFKNQSEADLLRRVADYDMSKSTPGTIHYGEWFQRAFIVGYEPSEITKWCHQEEITAILLDGQWGKWNSLVLWPTADDPDADYLDLPTDIPFDLMPPSGASFITNDSLLPSPVKLTFFGPAVNPYIIIGTNRYEIKTTIPSGSRIVVDGSIWPRTITMISDRGEITDIFSAGVRGDGEGSGNYIFEQIKSGDNGIQWPGSFGVNLDWLTQEGALPWVL